MKRNTFVKYIIIFISIISLFSNFLITTNKGYQCFLSEEGISKSENNIINNYIKEKEFLLETSINVVQDDDLSDIIISTHTTSESIYDISMMNFHNIFSSHSVSKGTGIDVLVIDTPVDYRHEIFTQDGYVSLTE